ncbi:M23 family metallopeptidase [Catellatospora tritici]|uniref:M23 family metallopeptidase n=1 Tax=Catellatospora tritici TaxID=2851566 RepID=UPI001C2D696B|nr:M23 family metallopeptidase [Catellatospora tritici]MBV1850575.1 M23 family metallopeptidase [Catellatospora tritici]
MAQTDGLDCCGGADVPSTGLDRRAVLRAATLGVGAAAGGLLTLPGTAYAAPAIYNPFTAYPISGSWADHLARGSLGGIDFAMPVGTPLPACGAGTVQNTPNNGTGGHTVTIQHADGYRSQYMHLSQFLLGNGTYVQAGTVVGLSGGAAGAPGSGNSTGPHLHWHMIDPAGVRISPLVYIAEHPGGAAPRQVYEAASNNAWRALPISGSGGAVTGSAVAPIALGSTKIVYTLNGGRVFEAASNAGWQNLWTGITGAQGTALAALNLNGVKLIYTVVDGYVHEAASNNAWRNLNSGISGVSSASISVIQLDGVKYVYSIVGGYVHEAHSANAWRNLNTGIPASAVAAITLGSTKIIYTVNGGSVYEAASNAGWQNLWTGISGVSGSTLAAMNVAGVKHIYTSAGGYVHEAASNNAWRNLNSGVGGSTVAVLTVGGVKLIYAA